MPNIVIAKNTTVSGLYYPELGGAVISGSGQTTLSDVSTIYEISLSSDLYTDIMDGKVIINDGNTDFNTASAVNYINFIDKKTALDFSIAMSVVFGGR